MEEIWKDIEGYEGLYQVSNMGIVRSLPHFRKNGRNGYLQIGKIIKPMCVRGYQTVSLSKNGKQKIFKIHRLVAEAFIPNPENKPCIDHINTDKTNNRVENLRWVTHKENSNNPLTLKKIINANNKPRKYRCGDEHPKPNLGKIGILSPSSTPILQFSLNGDFIKRWDSMADIEREMNISHSNLCKCCKYQRKTAYRFKWGYADDYEKIPFKVFDLQIYRKKVA